MQLSVVTVTHNSEHCISECLRGIRTALGDCEIVVVDNMSMDDTLARVRRADKDARVVRLTDNIGYGSACNEGMRTARHPHVLLMNPDVIIDGCDQTRLQASFKAEPFGLVAPSLRVHEGLRARPSIFAETRWFPEVVEMALRPFRPREFAGHARLSGGRAGGWPSGALLLVRRGEFLHIGGFDGRFFLYYEDRELSARYRKGGLTVRGTDALTATHSGGRSVAPEDDRRVLPMAWCLLSWLELVATRLGPRRAQASWIAVRCSYRTGRRLISLATVATKRNRLRRKAEQLRMLDGVLAGIAAAGTRGEHTWCPTACRVVGADGARSRRPRPSFVDGIAAGCGAAQPDD